MKKIIFTVMVIVSVYIVALVMRGEPRKATAQVLPPHTEYPTSTVTPKPTRTEIPTATIDYEQTAIVAQATADEARRINAGATAEHESVLLAQSQLTAQSESNALTMLQLTAQWEGITATAALTSIPMTATQQAINNTQVPAAQTLQAAQLKATIQAPTQYVAMQQAINYQRYGGIDYFARWAMYVVIAVFTLALVAWFMRNPVLPKPAQSHPTEYTVINRKREPSAGNGYQMTRFVVPCSPEQLTELAKGIADGSKSWAINQWEGSGTSLTRDTILRVRAWARDNKFVLATANDELVTTDAGTDFLIDWLDSQHLPDNYAFEAETQETEFA